MINTSAIVSARTALRPSAAASGRQIAGERSAPKAAERKPDERDTDLDRGEEEVGVGGQLRRPTARACRGGRAA